MKWVGELGGILSPGHRRAEDENEPGLDRIKLHYKLHDGLFSIDVFFGEQS